MLDVVPDDDTSNEKLEILQNELVLGPNDTIEIHLAILRDISVPIISTPIGNEMLHEQHIHDEVGTVFIASERVEDVVIVLLIIGFVLKEIENRTTQELHLNDALVVVDDTCVLRHVECIELAAPLLVKIVLGDLPDDVSCDPVGCILFVNEAFCLASLHSNLDGHEIFLSKLNFDFYALVFDSSLLVNPFIINEFFRLLHHLLNKIVY